MYFDNDVDGDAIQHALTLKAIIAQAQLLDR